jgi:putative Mg2+ transporter-C (MgtC) family protein
MKNYVQRKAGATLDNPWIIEPLHITLRLLLALVLGGLIGLEREQNSHAAGFRTHILVCLGSALIMLLSIYGFPEFVDEPNVRVDPARLAAQVISGIGFLGAGTILRNGLSISGLTTAASLWVCAAIGLAVGAGFYFAAMLACVMVLLSLWVLHIVEKKFFRNKKYSQFKITVLDRPGSLASISTVLAARGIDIRQVSLEESGEDEDQNKKINIFLTVKVPKPSLIPPTVEEIKQVKGVSGVSVD